MGLPALSALLPSQASLLRIQMSSRRYSEEGPRCLGSTRQMEAPAILSEGRSEPPSAQARCSLPLRCISCEDACAVEDFGAFRGFFQSGQGSCVWTARLWDTALEAASLSLCDWHAPLGTQKLLQGNPPSSSPPWVPS